MKPRRFGATAVDDGPWCSSACRRPYWPIPTEEGFDREPPAFCYAFAQNYKTLLYYRMTPPARPGRPFSKSQDVSRRGHPAMFASPSTARSARQTRRTHPVPFGRERIEGGHACGHGLRR